MNGTYSQNYELQMKPKINYKSIMTEHGLMAYEQS
jgi:hypothetical protein